MVNWLGGSSAYPTKYEKSVIRPKIQKIIKSLSISIRIWLADRRSGRAVLADGSGLAGICPPLPVRLSQAANIDQVQAVLELGYGNRLCQHISCVL